jgi:hypothetical protein
LRLGFIGALAYFKGGAWWCDVVGAKRFGEGGGKCVIAPLVGNNG